MDKPLRIVSLVPSITELLHHLNLHQEVVGITKFCVHPEAWFRTKPRIGGTKQVDAGKVQALHPTLILANREENVKEQVEALQAFCPVYVSEVATLPEALVVIGEVGALTGRETEAGALIQAIEARFQALPVVAPHAAPGVVYLIWNDPPMSVGGDTFISDLLSRAGFRNLLQHRSRYPALTVEEIRQLDPRYIFLSSEPFPFQEQHRAEWQLRVPGARVVRVDGEMFSWYGSHLLLAPDYFLELKKNVQR